MSRSYPEDRRKMLQVVATMMRSELAEITDEEILREVPLLFFLGESFIKRLTALVEVGVARKAGEGMKGSKRCLRKTVKTYTVYHERELRAP